VQGWQSKRGWCALAFVASIALVGASDDKVEITIRVTDAESGELLPHRLSIEAAGGIVHFPEERGPHARRTRLRAGDRSELEVIDGGRVWSLQPEGTARLYLPAEDGFVVRVRHGLEYERLVHELDLSGSGGESHEVALELRRLVDMEARGWMSADTHVHSMTPDAVRISMTVEDVDYVNLMLYHEDDPAWKLGLGLVAPPDGDRHIVYVSQEVRDFQQGHLTLLGLDEPIEPIREYTGWNERHPQTPVRPNEPLNWDVVRRANDQGALAAHAHMLLWPGHGLAACAALDRLDAVEWLETDIVGTERPSRQPIEVGGFEGHATNRLWYRLLDCGLRLPLVGGTDKVGNAMVIGGSARTYVHVPRWSHSGFLDGIRVGATFVTNGPLLFLEIAEQPPGSEIVLAGDEPYEVEIDIECRSWSPIDVVEILVDGRVASRVQVEGDEQHGWVVDERRTVEFQHSGWVAARARAVKADPETWQSRIPAAHTSPIWIRIDGRPSRPAKSALYLAGRLEQSLKWAETEGEWSDDENEERALDGFRRARAFYERLKRGR